MLNVNFVGNPALRGERFEQKLRGDWRRKLGGGGASIVGAVACREREYVFVDGKFMTLAHRCAFNSFGRCANKTPDFLAGQFAFPNIACPFARIAQISQIGAAPLFFSSTNLPLIPSVLNPKTRCTCILCQARFGKEKPDNFTHCAVNLKAIAGDGSQGSEKRRLCVRFIDPTTLPTFITNKSKAQSSHY